MTLVSNLSLLLLPPPDSSEANNQELFENCVEIV